MSTAAESEALRQYLHILRRRKWVVLQAVVIIPTLAVVLALRQHKLYEATADVLVNRQNLASTLTGLQDPNAFLQPQRVSQTQAEIARTPALARRVLDALGLKQRRAKDFLASSSVVSESDADVLRFSVRDRN